MTFVYCIEHERMVKLECGPLLTGHVEYIPAYQDDGFPGGVEVDCCELPLGFAFCPPPEPIPMESFDNESPSDEELLAMSDESIRELMEDVFQMIRGVL